MKERKEAVKKGSKETAAPPTKPSRSALPTHTWAERRLRRILRHNGEEAAQKWAKEHSDPATRGAEKLLEKLLVERHSKKITGDAKPQARVVTPTRPRQAAAEVVVERKLVITVGLPPITQSLGEVILASLSQATGVPPGDLARQIAEEAAKAPVAKAKSKRRPSAKKATKKAMAKPIAKVKPKGKKPVKKVLTDFFHRSASA